MPNIADIDLFCRIEDGKIIDYPVFRSYITARAHPVSFYTPVVDDPQPEVPRFHFLKEELEITDEYVERHWVITPESIDQILTHVYGGNSFDTHPEPIYINQVDPHIVQRVYKLVGEHVDARMTAFVQTRTYTDLDSILGRYANTTIPQFKKESERVQQLLDASWKAMLAYFEQQMKGEVPVPRSVADIEFRLPILTWDEEEVRFPVKEEPPVEQAPETPLLEAPVYNPNAEVMQIDPTTTAPVPEIPPLAEPLLPPDVQVTTEPLSTEPTPGQINLSPVPPTETNLPPSGETP